MPILAKGTVLAFAVMAGITSSYAQSGGGAGGGGAGGSGSAGGAAGGGPAGAGGATTPSTAPGAARQTTPSPTRPTTPGLAPGQGQVPSRSNREPTSPAQPPAAGEAASPRNDLDSLGVGRGETGINGIAGQQPNAPSTGGVSSGARKTDGARDSMADCMAAWDPGTHMTKEAFARTCRRTMSRAPDIK